MGNCPMAFDPVHFNDPTARFPTAETSILQVSAVGNLAVGSLKWTGSAIVHCLWSLLKATLQQYPSKVAPKLVYSGAPTAAGSSRRVLSAAGWHQILGPKRDEVAQQNEAPVAGSVEGQSVPVKIETLVRKVVQLKQCNRTGGNGPGKSGWMQSLLWNLTRCHSYHSQQPASTCDMELRQ
ncbi:hypothetical protein EMCRGX_G028037 [Ephydatia muelleri]